MAEAERQSSGGQSARIADLRWMALLLTAALITIAFLGVVRPFLLALVMAAITAGLAAPSYRWLLPRLGGRRALASAVMLMLIAAMVILPLVAILMLAASQAADIAGAAADSFRGLDTSALEAQVPDWLPVADELQDLGPVLIEKARDAATQIAEFAISSLSAVTTGAVSFLLNFFIYFYALFFFIKMERPIAREVMSYSALPEALQETLWERVVSVSRATIKGTLLIGIVQGALGGIGFWAAGISGAVFWSVVMAVFSVIPGIGPTFIIFCGVIYLVIENAYTAAAGLAIWGMLVVGTSDNVLRPTLVGRDAKMHDIMILISTLGGLSVFGALGLVLGPVLAGLFLSIWQTMRDLLEPEPEAKNDTSALGV